jgi:hypothetical protein
MKYLLKNKSAITQPKAPFVEQAIEVAKKPC